MSEQQPMDFSSYVSQIRNAVILGNENLKAETLKYVDDMSVKLASALQQIEQLKSELAKNEEKKGKSKKQ
jgi:hypothetical protein